MPVLRIPNVGTGTLSFEDMKYLAHNDVDEANQVHENDLLIIRSNGSRDLIPRKRLMQNGGLPQFKPVHNSLCLFLRLVQFCKQAFNAVDNMCDCSSIKQKICLCVVLDSYKTI